MGKVDLNLFADRATKHNSALGVLAALINPTWINYPLHLPERLRVCVRQYWRWQHFQCTSNPLNVQLSHILKNRIWRKHTASPPLRKQIFWKITDGSRGWLNFKRFPTFRAQNDISIRNILFAKDAALHLCVKFISICFSCRQNFGLETSAVF